MSERLQQCMGDRRKSYGSTMETTAPASYLQCRRGIRKCCDGSLLILLDPQVLYADSKIFVVFRLCGSFLTFLTKEILVSLSTPRLLRCLLPVKIAGESQAQIKNGKYPPATLIHSSEQRNLAKYGAKHNSTNSS